MLGVRRGFRMLTVVLKLVLAALLHASCAAEVEWDVACAASCDAARERCLVSYDVSCSCLLPPLCLQQPVPLRRASISFRTDCVPSQQPSSRCCCPLMLCRAVAASCSRQVSDGAG